MRNCTSRVSSHFHPSHDFSPCSMRNGTYVCAHDTVPLVLWCAAHQLRDYRRALWTTASALGDRDTTCAMVGGIVACRVGHQGLPTDWLARREQLPSQDIRPRPIARPRQPGQIATGVARSRPIPKCAAAGTSGSDLRIRPTIARTSERRCGAGQSGGSRRDDVPCCDTTADGNDSRPGATIGLGSADAKPRSAAEGLL
jgi:hypothetical protein